MVHIVKYSTVQYSTVQYSRVQYKNVTSMGFHLQLLPAFGCAPGL
jgi:hypothetical protein